MQFKTTGSPPPPSYGLTVTVEGPGSGTVSGVGISCPGSCSGSYDVGSRVTLTATPSSGSTFTGWGGACSGTGACEVTMNAAEHVTASFAQSPSGGNSGGSTGSGAGNTSPGAGKTSPGGSTPEGGKPGPEGEVAAADESRAVLLLASSTVEVQSNGVAMVKIECGGVASCHGKLTLTVKQSSKGKHKHAHTVSIGTATCSLSAHHKETVKVRLSATARGVIEHAHGHLSAHLELLGSQGTAPAHEQVKKVNIVAQKSKAAAADFKSQPQAAAFRLRYVKRSRLVAASRALSLWRLHLQASVAHRQ